MIREIQPLDYYKNYLNLLKELTEVGEHNFNEFYNKILEIKNNYHKIFVIEKNDKIVGSFVLLKKL